VEKRGDRRPWIIPVSFSVGGGSEFRQIPKNYGFFLESARVTLASDTSPVTLQINGIAESMLRQPAPIPARTMAAELNGVSTADVNLYQSYMEGDTIGVHLTGAGNVALCGFLERLR